MAQSGCRSAADGAKRLSVVDDDAERLVEAEQPRKCAVARTDSPMLIMIYSWCICIRIIPPIKIHRVLMGYGPRCRIKGLLDQD
mgnify:CR=1 FL=1